MYNRLHQVNIREININPKSAIAGLIQHGANQIIPSFHDSEKSQEIIFYQEVMLMIST